jgi:hypothetical protein
VEQQLDYRGQMAMTAAVLPARAAYLINAGSTEGFRKAALAASGRWGGAAEPIIQVAADGGISPEDSDLARRAEVVCVINVDADCAAAKTVAATLNLPCEPLDPEGQKGLARFTFNPMQVLATNGMSEFFCATEGAALWEVAAAGSMSDTAAELGRGPMLIARRARAEAEVVRAQCETHTFLDATVHKFHEHWRTVSALVAGPAVLWVSDTNDLEDCRAFWNLRAIGPRGFHWAPMVLVPSTAADWDATELRPICDMLARPTEVSPDIVICSRNVNSDRLHQIAALLSFQQTDTWDLSGRYPPPPLRQAPFSYQVNANLRELVSYERQYGLLT